MTSDWVICLLVENSGELDALEATLTSEGILHAEVPVFVLHPPAVPIEPVATRLGVREALTWVARDPTVEAHDVVAIRTIVEARMGEARDLLLLRPGVLPPKGFDCRLATAMRLNDRIAALFPTTGTEPFAFALFPNDPACAQAEASYIDNLLLEYAPGLVFDVPEAWDGCGYFRQAALAELTATVAYAELGQQLRQNGWALVGVDHVYVADANPGRKPWVQNTPEIELKQLRQGHPLTGLRHAMQELVSRHEPVAPTIHPPLNPVRLHVAHSWGGGLGRWVEDFAHADTARHSLILRSIGNWGALGEKIALFRADNPTVPLREQVLSVPIRATALTSHDYRRFLDEIVHDFQIHDVIVSSLIGHSLDILHTGLPTVVVGHDFHPFCAALNVIFGSPCTGCDPQRLEHCFLANPNNRLFRGVTAQEWALVREAWMDALSASNIQYVAPTHFVAQTLQTLAHRAPGNIRVIPHGMDLPPPRAMVQPPSQAGERLRVVVLGRLTREKGRDILLATLPALSTFADIHLLGCGDHCKAFEGHPSVTCTPHYEHTRLGELLAELSPDVGLLLSIVPETFSYTLSELWHYQVPPVATSLGSFAERIEHGRTGYLVAPEPDRLIDTLRAIHADRSTLNAIRNHLGDLRQPSRTDMVQAYDALLPVSAAEAALVPRARLRLPAHVVAQSQPFYVDHQIPFRRVLEAFLVYAEDKFRHSDRLPSWLGRMIAGMLKLTRRGLGGA